MRVCVCVVSSSERFMRWQPSAERGPERPGDNPTAYHRDKRSGDRYAAFESSQQAYGGEGGSVCELPIVLALLNRSENLTQKYAPFFRTNSLTIVSKSS